MTISRKSGTLVFKKVDLILKRKKKTKITEYKNPGGQRAELLSST